MLKNRLIACLPLYNNFVVQSIGFEKMLPVGSPKLIIEYLCQWGYDEIILLDITASKIMHKPNLELIKKISNAASVPLGYGGGIRNLEDAKYLVANGVDKVLINSSMQDKPSLVSEIANALGSQCIIASLDFKKIDGQYFMFRHTTREILPVNIEKLVANYQNLGVGEFLVTSVDGYGMKNGYDTELLVEFSNYSSVPVIALGGGYKANHFENLLLNTSIKAFAVENSLLFKEHSGAIIKSMLVNPNSFRLDTLNEYLNYSFDSDGRIKKRNEHYLESLFYQKSKERVL
jgi:cyclase